jgi:hypothetical protein
MFQRSVLERRSGPTPSAPVDGFDAGLVLAGRFGHEDTDLPNRPGGLDD